jgi:hypothetical protein
MLKVYGDFFQPGPFFPCSRSVLASYGFLGGRASSQHHLRRRLNCLCHQVQEFGPYGGPTGSNGNITSGLTVTRPGEQRDRTYWSVSLSVEIEMNKTTCAENHTCDQKQTETLPVSYSLQSENLRHGNVPEQLKNQRHNKNSYDRETDGENHAKLLAA